MKKTLFLILIFSPLLSSCVQTEKPQFVDTKVYYAGEDNHVKSTLQNIGYVLVDNFDDADVFVLNGMVVSPYSIYTKVNDNLVGLILIPGKCTRNYGADMDVEVLLGQPVADLMYHDNPVRISVNEDHSDDELITEIDWENAPLVSTRQWLSAPGPGTSLLHVESYTESIIEKTSDREYYLSLHLDDENNLEFQEWEYFDYLIYHLVERAAGNDPLSYTEFSELYIPN